MVPEDTFNSVFGIVASSTRRFTGVLTESGSLILATASRKFPDLVPGDKVRLDFDTSSQQAHINEQISRYNCLKRSYFNKQKILAANVSRLWIVCAPPPLFNTAAIDRTLLAADEQSIPVSIIANKVDLEEFTLIKEALNYYQRRLNIVIHNTSAKAGIGLNTCLEELQNNEITVVTGISGVGKSSLLSQLLQSDIRVGSTSEKTGQGKQTTSSAQGYPIVNNKNAFNIVIDLPGIQSFGVTHINKNHLSYLMKDIKKISEDCRFDNCSHIKEKDCAVKIALENKILLDSRYQSYLDMLKEIENSMPY